MRNKKEFELSLSNFSNHIFEKSVSVFFLLITFFFILKTAYQQELNSPVYSLNSTNSTLAGTDVMHSLFWEDDYGLSGYIFSFDNGTGDGIIQFNQTSSTIISGVASTIDQQTIDSCLNFNTDGLTWDIAENELPAREQKTVEYFIYQDMTQMAANTEKSASFTVYIPENNPRIKSAIVEIKNNIYNTQITAGQTIKLYNGTTNTTLLTTAAGPAATGENMPYVIIADATPALSYIDKNGTYIFTLYVKLNAIRQGENAKLILTYEHDSDSPRQIKTVRFFIGQLTTTLPVGSSTAFTVPALNLPESNVVVRDSFFETYIHLQPGGTTDEGISINLDGSNAISGTPIDNAGATTTTHIFLYKNIFDTTISHTFNFLPTAGYALHGVGTELVLTYEYDASSPVQLKTLRYLIGQDGNLYTTNHTATFQKQVFLPENNKIIRSAYNRVTFAIAYGSGAGNTAYTTYIGINSSLQGYQQPQVTYALGLRDEQVSTTTLLYNASGLYSLGDSNIVVCSVFSSATSTSYYTGSKGCELIITYIYDAKSSTRARTVEYFVGQSYNSSLATSVSFPFQLQIPEQTYSIKDAYLTVLGFTGSATAGTNTLVSYINIPGYVSQTCNFRNTGEARFDMCWDYVGDNVTVANSYTAVLSSGVTRWFSSKITVTYTYNPFYQLEVEHSTNVNYPGNLEEIDVMINFTSTLDDFYSMSIYDFINSAWDSSPCQSISVSANVYHTIWCNVTKNKENYISSDKEIRVRLNSTVDNDMGILKEEYVQFYLSYTGFINDTFVPFEGLPTKAWSNVTKTVNSTVGSLIRWRVYANNTNNNWNASEIFTYITSNLGYLEVELQFPLSYNVAQNKSFLLNATVFCRNGSCGDVFGTPYYNLSSLFPDTQVNTSEGDKPFYVQEPPYPSQASKACPTSPLEENEFCNLTWIINATGDVYSSWKLGVLFNSSFHLQNHTNNSTITITLIIESFSFSFDSIDFGALIPNTKAENNPAPGNLYNSYNITNTGTCDLQLWIKGTDLINSTFNSFVSVGNLSWSNYSSIYNPNTVYPLSYHYKLLYSALPPNSNLTLYYWLSVPSVYAGIYKGTIAICGNCSSSLCD
ncbi:MAG: hypothetical protein QXQ77_01915 [Candidatus Aenigmatarchaeota archaeon]